MGLFYTSHIDFFSLIQYVYVLEFCRFYVLQLCWIHIQQTIKCRRRQCRQRPLTWVSFFRWVYRQTTYQFLNTTLSKKVLIFVPKCQFSTFYWDIAENPKLYPMVSIYVLIVIASGICVCLQKIQIRVLLFQLVISLELDGWFE